MKRSVVIFANDSWYILKFRGHLITKLVPDYRVVVVSGDDQYAHQLTALGAEVKTIPMSPRSVSPFKILQATFYFLRLVRRERPSHVLTFNPSAGLITALAARVTRMRQIATVSGFGKYKFLFSQTPKALRYKVLRFALEQLLVKWPEVSVVQNGADFEYVKSARGPHRETVRVMGSGVDLTEFGFVERDFSTLRILFAARFLLEKGILDYIYIARQLESVQLQFSICGLPVENDDGLDDVQLKEAIKGTDIAFLGEISDMSALLAKTDVVVLPSLYGEGIPRILIEASASGCLLVAHDIDGVREVVVNGQTGVLTDTPTREGLLDAMKDLLALDPEKKAQMSRAGHGLAAGQFDLQDVTGLYVDILTTEDCCRNPA